MESVEVYLSPVLGWFSDFSLEKIALLLLYLTTALALRFLLRVIHASVGYPAREAFALLSLFANTALFLWFAGFAYQSFPPPMPEESRFDGDTASAAIPAVTMAARQSPAVPDVDRIAARQTDISSAGPLNRQ